MSKMSKIKGVIYTLLEDGKGHTIDEIKKVSEKEGVILEPGDTLIRSTLYNLQKKDSSIVRISRGTYKMNKVTVQDNEFKQIMLDGKIVSNLAKAIEETAIEISQFNWRSCSDEELQEARRKDRSLKEIKESIDTYNFNE